jgi:hypothetical protein
MYSDQFYGIEILQGRWQHGEKVGYCYPSGLEKTLCKWDIYVPLVTRGLSLYIKLTLALLWKGYRNTRSYGMPKVMGHDNHVPLAHTL